jgi:hypothetical protein
MKHLEDLKLMKNVLSQEMRRNLDHRVKKSCYLQGKREDLIAITNTTIRIEVDGTLGSSTRVKDTREETLTGMANKIRRVKRISLRQVMTTIMETSLRRI